MKNQNDPRVERMFSGDRFASLIALATLWAVYAFVFFKIIPLSGGGDVLYVLAGGAALVLLFNTASIFAMLSHYGDDKQHIYGLDLHYLDIMNKNKG